MKQITEINDDAYQEMTLVTEDGEEVAFLLKFMPTQLSWFFSVTYNDITINNNRLSNFPNILRNYKNLFPFGIWCFVNDGEEPFQIDDFSTERVILYLLTEDEVTTVEQDVFEEIS